MIIAPIQGDQNPQSSWMLVSSIELAFKIAQVFGVPLEEVFQYEK